MHNDPRSFRALSYTFHDRAARADSERRLDKLLDEFTIDYAIFRVRRRIKSRFEPMNWIATSAFRLQTALEQFSIEHGQ